MYQDVWARLHEEVITYLQSILERRKRKLLKYVPFRSNISWPEDMLVPIYGSGNKCWLLIWSRFAIVLGWCFILLMEADGQGRKLRRHDGDDGGREGGERE